jgi:hypothetical protein
MLKAYKVLEDCGLALHMLENEKDADRWRVIWAGAIALVRAVGHVLDKVDGRDARIKAISNRLYNQWKKGNEEDRIFLDFIEAERNNLLKEYESGVHPLAEANVLFDYQLVSTEDKSRKISLKDIAELPDNIYKPMLQGYGEGDDARDVLTEAIEWWERQLKIVCDEVLTD